MVWVWKLNHNKDSRHVSPITDSQTVQVQTCTDTLGHDNNSKFRLRNSALLVVCRTALWTVASVVCSFCEVFCLKEFWFIIFSSSQGSDDIILTPSVICVLKWTSNLRGDILPRFKKCYELYFGCKWVTKIKVGPPPCLLWNDCEASHAKCRAPYPWYEENQKTSYPIVTFV